jgi:23S rRNA (uracil1939-C5)-methyltransferase
MLGEAELEIEIDHLGSAGDGVARLESGVVLHVAHALPGEIARVRVLSQGPRGARGHVLSLETPSPDRVTPPCPHFEDYCGGCALQHLQDRAYADWKRDLVVAALQRAGIPDPPVAPLIRTPPAARRRMDLAVRRREGGVDFGLHCAQTTEIVDMSVCEVLHPTLFALIAPLRKTLSSLAALRGTGAVIVNLLASGPDLLIRTDGPLTPQDRAKLAAFATAHAVPRIAWALGNAACEVAAQAHAPHEIFAGHRVDIPPGAFLQASAIGEAAIVAAVLAGLPKKLTGKSRAIELFAGCGTLSFPLATRLRVLAYEGESGAAAAVRRAQAGSRVEMTQRDLARQPLSAKEFSGAALVVLDPPYGGAAAQMPAIAASGVKQVIYVSCNPGALTKDAAVLVNAGYALQAATPIDQFLWSAQVECVAVFSRE